MKILKNMRPFRFASLIVISLLVVALFTTGKAETGNGNSGSRSINDLSGIDRDTWKSLPPQIRIPVYKTFSYEKKRDFWRLKHEELMKLNWNQAELEHINLFYSVICEDPILMERGVQSEEIEDRFEIFLYNWKEHAREVLGWNVVQVFAVSGSGDEVLNTRGEIKIYTPQAMGIRFAYGTRSLFDDCSCPTSEYRIIRHPYNCNMFIICAWGTRIEMSCPLGLYFDVSTQVCNWPALVKC